jgi:hypothetical protein
MSPHGRYLTNLLRVRAAENGPNLPMSVGQSMSALPGISDIDLFGYREGIIDFDPEVSDGAFDFGVAKQELHGPQVASSAVDQRRLGSSQRMCTKKLWVEPNAGNPSRKEPCVLPCRHASAEPAPAVE